MVLMALALVAGAATAGLAHGLGGAANHVGIFKGTGGTSVGLTFPGVGAGVVANWNINATGDLNAGTVLNTWCEDLASIANANSCTLAANGQLGAVSGITGTNLGGWCGLSRGYDVNDSGTYRDSGGSLHNRQDVGWITSVGTILVITGHWSGGGNNGNLVALVRASASNLALCATTGGANQFDVLGVAALI